MYIYFNKYLYNVHNYITESYIKVYISCKLMKLVNKEFNKM